MSERAERLLGGPLRYLLVGPWLCYRPLVWLRNRAYDLGLLPTRRLPVPVLSVGNLAVGGTGKTPVVDACCRLLADAGRRPAVLSRGYRGDGDANDEARMLEWPVVCDPDRFRGGRRAIAAGATALVLDDGFQHRRLARDLDVVCIDATRPWGRSDGGRGRTLPLGLLREPARALRRAQLVLITRSDQAPPERLERLRQWLAKRVERVAATRHQPRALSDLADEQRQPPSAVAGERWILLSAIGHPRAFERTVRDLGGQVVDHRIHRDHHHYRPRDVQAALAVDPAARILTTAKDAVKLRDVVAGPEAERIRVLSIELACDRDEVLRAAIAALLRVPPRP